MKLTTSLSEIYAVRPCVEGITKLRQHLGKTAADARSDTTQFDLSVVLDSNGIDDALWVLDNVIRNKRIIGLFSADCAERVHHLFAAVRPNDDRPMTAIRVARDPDATDEQRAAAGAAAGAAAWAAAGAGAWAAAGAGAGAAAWAAAGAGAGAAAGAAAWAAAGAGAGAAAGAAAGAGAGAAAGAAHKDRLRQYITHGEAASEMPWPDAAAEKETV
ncbi:hypothetical protein [Paenirhodobacter populi]|uniref:hypothetical protein n=1 Tax=Paenirhodobacter populi TaxID=2306993 RepID=UPI0013E3D9F7|nr:hypothetical protein [Sinirhodobacter populi]